MSEQTISTSSEAAPEAAPAPNLAIQDLLQIVQIISIVTQRGAIRAAEMTQVGAVYDKLILFLEANGAIQRKPATAPEGEQATPPQET